MGKDIPEESIDHGLDVGCLDPDPDRAVIGGHERRPPALLVGKGLPERAAFGHYRAEVR